MSKLLNEGKLNLSQVPRIVCLCAKNLPNSFELRGAFDLGECSNLCYEEAHYKLGTHVQR
jgi:hypothetical protein